MIGRRPAGCEPGEGGAAAAGGDAEGGVSAGIEIGADGVNAGDGATGACGTAGVARSPGSVAPSAGLDGGVRIAGRAGGVGIRAAGACGVGTRGAAAAGVAARWGAGGVATRGDAGGVAGPAMNGRGDDGRDANASPIGSAATARCWPELMIPTGMTPPHVEQRARTPPCGTFAGSTR